MHRWGVLSLYHNNRKGCWTTNLHQTCSGLQFSQPPQSYPYAFLWYLTHFPGDARCCLHWKAGKGAISEGRKPIYPAKVCWPPRREKKKLVLEKELSSPEVVPQALQTPAFRGYRFAFPRVIRVRVFQRQACGLKKKKIMFNLKIRNWSRLWAQGLIETKFKFLSSPFKHGGPS